MKKNLLLTAAMLVAVCWAQAQQRNFWKASSPPASEKLITSNARISSYQTFDLDLSGLKEALRSAPGREAAASRAPLTINFPTPDGTIEKFTVVEANTLHPDLLKKYPGILSYAGQGVEDPTATIRFSLSDQQGFHGMVLSGNKSTYYIDPQTTDFKSYKVYGRESMVRKDGDFVCTTDANRPADNNVSSNPTGRTNDKKLRRYRLALSCTAEYGNLFAGTGTDAQKKANILARMNITMTRVNGVYEKDLAITMQIVANNDLVIYFGSTTADPWSNEWNSKTQQVIDAAIGSANYDIGHNFNTTGGGNAGCIGCVCTSGSKGSGYTGRADPTGDAFDIDYVAHEMGHQFGGYHTMNTCSRSGSGSTEVEPASGSSIMGYAGICPTNIQPNSDAYFAYVNIRDISANVQSGTSSSCAAIVNIANNPPTANAGLDYTIPKSTAFVLRGSGSDPDGDALTYNWEQNDPAQAPGTGSPASTWTVGPMFRSKTGTSSPDRYMPQISDVVANNLAPTWEVIPSVGRTLNFSLTVRDNKAGGGQTSDDLMVVTVNGTAGPFVVSAPNTAVTWNAGSSQTVTWSVASTNVAPVNCANVNILLSTDGGFTYPITLLANTPNDGSQAITVPNVTGTTCRVKVEAAGNIFYDISNVNFTISGAVPCTATVPTGLAASGISSSGATLSWSAVSGATYDLRYRIVGSSTWTTISSSSTSAALTGLTASSNYEAQVSSKCPDLTSSAFSASVNFTTLSSTDTQAPSTPTNLAASGITTSSANLSWTASTDNVGVTGYEIRVNSVLTATVATTTYSLTGLSAATTYAVSVTAKDAAGNASAAASINVTTLSSLTYCASKGNIVTDEYISRVQFGTINNVSGANAGYGNFTALSTSVTRGTAYTITITPTWTGTIYSEGYSVWVDYNKDGDFLDAGEQVWTKAASKTTPVSGSFTIPASASLGATRMRVSMKYNGIPTSCETFTYGEVEDYTVNISSTARLVTEEVNMDESIQLYPVPVQDRLYVKIAADVQVKSMHIVSPTGANRELVKNYQDGIDVQHLREGLYILSVDTDKGMQVRKFLKK